MGVVLLLFVLWMFRGDKEYPFVGFAPLLDRIRQEKGILDAITDEIRDGEIRDGQDDGEENDAQKNNGQDEARDCEARDETPVKPPVRVRKFASNKEGECCTALEDIYGVQFDTVRPEWLRNPKTGKNLELDCYNDKLKIGLEYQGEQHYKFPNHFHKTKEEWIKQVQYDQYKRQRCDEEGVYLITVPYDVPLHEIRDYIEFYLPERVRDRMRVRS